MDKGTIKEICDVVTSEVMKQVQSNLSDMKPELVHSVTEAASRKAIEKLYLLFQRGASISSVRTLSIF